MTTYALINSDGTAQDRSASKYDEEDFWGEVVRKTGSNSASEGWEQDAWDLTGRAER